MKNAIGDALNNPNIKDSNAERKREEANKLAYALEGGLQDLAFLPDAILNLLTPNDMAKALKEHSDKNGGWDYKDPIETLFKKTGIMQDLPEPELMENRIAKGLGGAIGSMAIPGAGAVKGALKGGKLTQGLAKSLLGVDKPVTSASQLINKQAAKTVGGTITQGVAQPFIEDYTDNPLARILLSMGAGGGGGKALASFLKNPAQSLPSATAAQTLFAQGKGNERRTKDLVSKQLDLAKSDPKSADLLQQIASAQEQNIYNKIPKSGQTSPEEIAKKIKTVLDDFKIQKNAEYEAIEKELFSHPKAHINTDKLIANAFGEINDLDLQSRVRKTMTGYLARINNAKNNPARINSIRKEINDSLHPNSPLYLGNSQSSILGKLSKDIGSALEESLPGYKELLNEPYAKKMKVLEDWINGPVGKVFKKSESARPSEVFKTIFENTDKRLAGQLKEILPPELYSKAADEYLAHTLTRLAQETPTKNAYNKFTPINAIKDKLIKNRSQLEATLPEAQNRLINEIIADIEQTSLGRPRNDFVVDSGRTISVGDEIKGLGKKVEGFISSTAAPLLGLALGGPAGVAAGLGANKLGNMGMKYLNRNEMLTGQSPLAQIGSALPVNASVQSGMRAAALAPQEPPSSEFIPQNYTQPAMGNNKPEPQEDPFKSIVDSIRLKSKGEGVNNESLPDKVNQGADPFEQIVNDIKRKSQNPLN